MVNAEDPEPENELTGIISPSPDVMTSSAPPSLNVIHNEELTPEDSPNPGPSRSFLDIAPLPKNKKTGNPTANKRGKCTLRFSRPPLRKSYWMKFGRSDLLQKTKEARERGKLRNQKGNDRKAIHLSRRERKLVAEKSFPKVLQKMRSRQ
jgi:hypothetical protein